MYRTPKICYNAEKVFIRRGVLEKIEVKVNGYK